MGEYQNKAVALMTARLGEKSTADPQERKQAFIAAAMELFYALGGTAEDIAAQPAPGLPPSSVDIAIGDLMQELAAIGTMKDLDIMQAAYNTLDKQRRSIRALLETEQKTG